MRQMAGLLGCAIMMGCPSAMDDPPVPTPTGAAPTAATGTPPGSTASTGQTGTTGHTGVPPLASCYQELAVQNGQVDIADDSVTIQPTLAITTSVGAPATPLPAGLDPAAFHGAVDPAAATGWWEGWTVTNPAIDGGLPGAAFHPLQAEIQSGTIVPASQSACTTLDADFRDGGTAVVFGATFPVCIVEQPILADQTWPNNHIFFLTETITVGTGDVELAGGIPETVAVLSIQPGTQIYGASNGSSLVITRGSEIDAEGTVELPIVFGHVEGDAISGITGNPEDLTGRGEWGGLVLSGYGQTNNGNVNGELLTEYVPPTQERWFGGNSNTDSSGDLRYVVIAESGIEIRQDVWMPGLGFEAVGSRTEVEYVQVLGGEGDCFAWFGGAVGPRWLTCSGPDRDGFDMDLGYRGQLQFGLVRLGALNGDRGFEIDNNGDNFEASPQTRPDIANVTILGHTGRRDTLGALTREGARERLFRTVFADDALAGGTFDIGCFDIDDALPGTLQWSDIVGDCTPASQTACEPGEIPGSLPGDTGMTGATGTTGHTGMPSPGTCYQELAVQNGQLDVTEDTVTLQGTLAVTPSVAGAPIVPLPAGFDPAAYYGAVDPAAVTGWWEGWTVQGPSIDGSFAGPAFHPLEAEIQNGTIVGAVVNLCTALDPAMSDGGTVTVFGETFPVCIVQSDITIDQTWPNSHVFFLTETVTVGTGDVELMGSAPLVNPRLTIQAGTQIYGSIDETSLVISRGASIDAQGTADLPILFGAVEGDAVSGITGDVTDLTDRGQWGGLVLSGFGEVNRGNANGELLAEDLPPSDERWFGGTDNGDGSGTLRYVVIAESGFEIRQDVEMAGLTLEGAGSTTTIEYLQVLGTEDDCLMAIGGAAPVKWLACTGPDNDGVDLDFGYQGNLQFGIVRTGTSNGDRGFEMDNNGGNFSASPVTRPRIANYTILGNVGKGSGAGAVSREGSSELVYRTAFVDDALVGGAFVVGGVDIDDALPPTLQWNDILTDVGTGGVSPCEPGELP
ncbi:MAG: hypothetical protein AAF211_10260 [Myxococcota bacterium]